MRDSLQETEIRVGWRMSFRSRRLFVRARKCKPPVLRPYSPVFEWFDRSGKLIPLVLLAFLMAATLPLAGRAKDKLSYGEGLIVNIPVPESEAEQVVQDVAQNGMIRGTKEYNKDEFVGGAKAADSSRVFPRSEEHTSELQSPMYLA